MTFARFMAAAAFGAVVFMCSAVSSHAAPTTREFTFSISNFNARGTAGGTSPFDTITGSFRVTFDFEVNQSETTEDIELIEVRGDGDLLELNSPVVFQYLSGDLDRLFVSGQTDGSNGVGSGGFDFSLAIANASRDGANIFGFIYFPGSGSTVFEGFDFELTSRDLTLEVSEPASAALIGFGLAGLALARRRRR